MGGESKNRRQLSYHGTRYSCREDETVLEALQRQGVSIPFSCRSGICHVCLQRCTSGPIPEKAQTGVRPTLRAQGYFLPCQCTPTADMQIVPPRNADLYTPAVLYRKEWLGANVVRLLLEPATALSYRAGQFINLRRSDGLTRSYSLASNPATDYFLELHVNVMKNGAMSNWIAETLAVNDEIDIQGPNGQFCYEPERAEQNILLAATGTGLAPLLGVVRDALHQGHTGELHLFHGSRHPRGVYLHDELLDLCGEFSNFYYYACVSGNDVPPGFLSGRTHEVAQSLHEDLRGWSTYFAGLPDMVEAAHRNALRSGVMETDIHTDPFRYTDLRGAARTGRVRNGGRLDRRSATPKTVNRRPGPDPEMWAALGEGQLLNTILTDFYDRVYEDPRLKPFFRGTTKQRSIEKQYLFLRQRFSGEKVYFGDRPRNAHHWMVISDELFDYREQVMESCLHRHGLPDHLIGRWLKMENSFRADIVKNAPWNRVIDGIEIPADGFGEAVLEVGTLCDSCGEEIPGGSRVRYHLRLGTTWCRRCMQNGDLETNTSGMKTYG
jgi:ferredoxin-NADP reductase/ferredoxin/truncated hemoglobin YjbI